MQAVLTEIITLITSGISGIATGIGSGLQTLATKIFLTGAGTTAEPYSLSVFGGLVVVFAGISLAFGICRWVLNFCSSLGQRNR